MDTVYYTLKTRKVKVSGGADLLSFVSAAVPAPAAPGGGEVLDFARCRQRLETKAAWKDLARAAEEAPACPEDGEDGAAAASPRSRRHGLERAAGWMELCASAAVLLVSLCAALAFLSLV